MNGEPDIVKNFLLKTLQIQRREKRIDWFKGEGAMPASFKVLHDPIKKTDTVISDFGESALEEWLRLTQASGGSFYSEPTPNPLDTIL